ncbi:MAG: NADP-dependent oxidoreductase [Alphaproteobacteria bacterium]|nr:NADP-dependent oxidoreductase [Alphaproteobacteria bacterium]
MAETYRCVVLARFVGGLTGPDDFAIEIRPVPEPGDGEILVRIIYASLDPGGRARLSGRVSYIPPLALGDVAGAFNIGQVVTSNNEAYTTGDLVVCSFGWTEMGLSKGGGYFAKIQASDLPLSTWIGVLGVPGLTAYFGLKRVAGIKAGETLVVTSAAGVVGATAAQIAKIMGCKVIDVAGGPEKCAWLRDELGLDGAIDYKAADDLGEAIGAAAPDGVDVLFDNVGNRFVDTLLPRMKMNGRIVVSGQVGDYNLAPEDVHGIKNTRVFITHRVRMEGLVVFDDLAQFPAAQAEMAAWIKAGKLLYREKIYDGVEQAPQAFRDMFEGTYFGRHLVRLAPEP